jgi:hypothetical protein
MEQCDRHATTDAVVVRIIWPDRCFRHALDRHTLASRIDNIVRDCPALTVDRWREQCASIETKGHPRSSCSTRAIVRCSRRAYSVCKTMCAFIDR